MSDFLSFLSKSVQGSEGSRGILEEMCSKFYSKLRFPIL